MGRILGIDYGDSRIGLALSDPTKVIASPFQTLHNKGLSTLIEELENIIIEKDIECFVIGLPISLDNSENKQSQLVRDFNINLQTFFKKPTVLWDERFSSDVIFKEMRKTDLSKTKIKSKLDQQSAAYILQGYLDRYRNN